MRVLVMATPSTTHFTCMVPLAWTLRAAGHEVHVVGQPDIAGAARGAGLPITIVGELFDVVELIAGSLPPGKRPVEVGLGRIPAGQWGMAGRTWVVHARYLVERYLAFARDWRPDLILADPLELSALMIGGVLGVPVVHHRWGVDPLGTATLRSAATALRRRAARLGLPDGVPDPDMILDPCPASLQVDWAAPGAPMRFVPYNGPGTLPPWADRPAGGVRVCVSLGRIMPALNGVPLIRTVVDAIGGMDGVEGVVAVGAEYHDQLGEVPASVRLTDSVPIHLFLDSCAAVVHHGGAGTGMTAAIAGIPQLVLTGVMDAFPYSERIAASGAGIGLDDAESQNDPAAIRAALRQLLDDPSYAAAAGRLRKEMDAMPTPAELVSTLEELG